jgi:CubicO group peptidase (beta-lactamase class C family)
MVLTRLVRTMKLSVRILQMVIIFSQSAFSQQVAARLDSLFSARFNKSQFNGNVLIAQKGTIIYQRSFGYADRDKDVLVNKASRFHLASTSKLFTAVAVLQLKEKGRIKLNDPIIKYVPDFPYTSITIRHLLTHTTSRTQNGF